MSHDRGLPDFSLWGRVKHAIEASSIKADVGIRYVATTGDDANDGLTWGTAKRQIQPAIASSGYEVRVGTGTFDPFVYPPDVSVIGSGSQTVIKAPDGFNDHVIQAQLPQVQHWTRIAHMKIDGNKANNTQGYGVYMTDCGEGLKLEHLLIVNCAEGGARVEDGTVPLYWEDLHCFGNGGPGVSIRRASGHTMATTYLNMVSGDDNVDSLVEIENNNSGPVVLVGIKSEVSSNQLVAVSLVNADSGDVDIIGLAHFGNSSTQGQAAIRATGLSTNSRVSWQGVKYNGFVDWVYENEAKGLQVPTNASGTLNTRGSEVAGWTAP